MIIVSSDTEGLKTIHFWIILFLTINLGNFIADSSASSQQRSSHRSKFRLNHKQGTKLSNDFELDDARDANSVLFQPGDFAGDYDLPVAETEESHVKSSVRTRGRTNRRKEKTSDLDMYKEVVTRKKQTQTYDAYREPDEREIANEETDEKRQSIEAPWEAPVVEVQQQKQQEFDDPTVDQNPEGIVDEVHKLEEEIKKLESERAVSTPDPNVKANLTFNLKWKQYKNLTDADTMELKYQVSGKDSMTVKIIFFIVMPSFLLICLIYLAVTLYWTKCWFWKVVPPDRFYQFERYEIEQDEDPTDLAPLLKTPLEALHDAELREARLESAPDDYRNTDTSGDEADPNLLRKTRRKTRERPVIDAGYDYDTDGRNNRSARTRDNRSDNDSTDRERQRRKPKR